MIFSASLFSDFSLSSSQEVSTAALRPAAWTITRPNRIVVTTPWTASVANCRPFSGVVTESLIHHSRFPNSPPAVTTAHSVASGTTWKPSWRKGPSTETRERGARRQWRRRPKGWVCRALQLPRGAALVPLSLCPPLPPQHAIPPRQLTSLTLSLAIWERGEVLMGVIWDGLRHGKGIAQRPQASPKSPLTLHSHENPSWCSQRARRRTRARLWVVPSPRTTAPSPTTSTSAPQTQGIRPNVSCLTQLWLWKDCPWEMEVGGPPGFLKKQTQPFMCTFILDLGNSSLTKNLTRGAVTIFFQSFQSHLPM